MSIANDIRLMNVLDAPHVSEKSTMAAEKNRQVVFKVRKTATKPAIKAAVEQLFNVKVASVNVSVVKGKTRSFRQIAGKRKDWKKAYVCLQDGFDIDFVGKESS